MWTAPPWKWRVKEWVKWKAGQNISSLIGHMRMRERDRDQEFLFSFNELTEAASISSNVMLKWKLIVQYTATAMGHGSCISISGGVTKWVCSLGPTPRKADTSTNQSDFSIQHCCTSGILDECVLYVCVCAWSKVRFNQTEDENRVGIVADELARHVRMIARMCAGGYSFNCIHPCFI